MPVSHSLLAILADRPAHGYGLKSSFERHTAGVWPLNVGQVYTTLARLERDGLVEAEGGDRGERRSWTITAAGRGALERWYRSPIDERPARDELAIKVLLAAAATSAANVGRIIQRQRSATMERLQDYTRHKRNADPERELPWLMLLDAMILKAEAEIRWLDLCEQRLC